MSSKTIFRKDSSVYSANIEKKNRKFTQDNFCFREEIFGLFCSVIPSEFHIHRCIGFCV